MSDPQPPKPPQTEKADPVLESLLAKARPIIAEERGLNHRSRVKIQSLGKKMKIPAAVIDQALQLLHGAPPVQGLDASGESRYERAFAKTMSEKIAAIPGKILTTKIEEKAMSIGIRKYQLSETQARNIIRRVAEETGVPRVTLSEAERHMEQEIADVIGEDTWVTGEKKQRLIRNAKRLGVTQEQTESMIQRHLQFNFQQVQFEKKLTDRLWIVAACIVVGTGLSLFVFFQLKQARKENQAVEQRENEKKKREKDKFDDLDKVAKLPEWWDDSLKLLLQKTRLKVAGFPTIHDQLKSRSPQKRARAYQDLFELGNGKVNPHVIRQRVSQVIPALFLAEPNAEALVGLTRGFDKSIKMPSGKVPTSVDFFNKAFWSLGLLNRIVGEDDLDDQKVVAIQKLIEPITGRKFDLFLSDEPRLEKQKRALIDSFFKQLTDLGNAYPTVAPEIFEKLEELVESDVSPDKMQEYRTMFLTSFLRFKEDSWSNSSRLIKRTVLESSSSQISFFIDLMESTSIEPLQIFLEESLLERAGVGDDFESVAELADKLRKYFEIGAPESVEKSESTRVLVNQRIDEFYRKWSVRSVPFDEQQSIQVMADAVYLTTLVAMLDSDQAEALDMLATEGFPDINDEGYILAVTGSPAEKLRELKLGPGDVSATFAGLDDDLAKALFDFQQFQKLSVVDRKDGFKVIVDNIQQLDARGMMILAKYLLSRKHPIEVSEVDKWMVRLKGSSRLLIAMGDYLYERQWLDRQLTKDTPELLPDQDLPRQTCMAISSELIGDEVRYSGLAWKTQLAERLWREGTARLRANLPDAAFESKIDPALNLRTLIDYFYRLRVRSLEMVSYPSSGSFDASLDCLIDYYTQRLDFEKENADDKSSQLGQENKLIEAFGHDPLTRLRLKQKSLLDVMMSISKDSSNTAESEHEAKLESLIRTKFSRIPSIIGQIVENEVRILLFYDRQKLK